MFSFNFTRWLKSWFRRDIKPIVKKRPLIRLHLEELESRLAPTVYTWTGGGGAADPDWSANANWTNGTSAVAPPVGTPVSLVFGTPTAYATVNDLAGLDVSSITFTSSNFTLTAKTAADSINLENAALITVQNGLSGEQVNLPMTLLGSQQFFDVNPGATLTLGTSGTITGNAASQLTAEGGGTLIIQSSNTAFTGPFTIGSNDTTTVIADANNAFGLGTAASNSVTVGSNSQLQLEGGFTQSNQLFLNGNGTSGTNGALENLSGNNTWAGGIVMENNAEINVATGSVLTVSGVIGDTGSGDSLTKIGQGQLILTNANTYHGQTDINQGILTIENPLALGAVPSAGTFTSASSISNTDQGSLQIELPTPLATAPANSQYYILANPNEPVSAANPYVGFVVPDYSLYLVGTGFDGNFTLDNAVGDNAWSGPVILDTQNGAFPTVNLSVDSSAAGVQSQLDITGVISDLNAAHPANIDKTGGGAANGTGNLVLEPTIHNASIDQGDTYQVVQLAGGFTDLDQFTGTGTPNTFAGALSLQTISGGTVTLEDSQGLGLTTKILRTDIGLGASLNLVSNVGHIDSVTDTTNRLLVDTPITINTTGFNNSGSLDSISGINTYGPNAAYNAANPATPYVIQVGAFTPASIGVQPDPTETSNDSYFTNDYSLTITGGIGNNPGGIDPVSVQLEKVGAGQLILPNANRYFYGGWVIAAGWVTVQDQYSLGGLIQGAVPDLSQGALFTTTVDSGAALMLRPYYPNTGLTLDTNLILEGDGISHPFSLINDMGALENLEGVNTIAGNIELIGQVGIGVEQVEPSILSNLTLTGQISQAQSTAAFNQIAIPASVTIPETYGSGGVSQYTQIVDTGSTEGTFTINYTNFKNDTIQVYDGPIGTPGSGLIYSGTFTGTGATPLTAFGPAAGSQLEIVIDDGTVGANTGWSYHGTINVFSQYFAGGLIKLGSQELVLQGEGTYQGGVDIRQGVLLDENSAALGTPLNTGVLGTTFGTDVEAGASLVLSPSVADLNGGISDGEAVWGTDLTLSGTGDTAFGYAPLDVLADDNEWTGSITLDADITIAYQGGLGDLALPADPITANFTNLTGTSPTLYAMQTTAGSAAANTDDVETLEFGGVVTGGTFTLTVLDGTDPATYFTTGNIAWSADSTTLIDNIEAALDVDPKLDNNFEASLVSPVINVAPDARLNVTGTIGNNTTVASPLIHNYVLSGASASYNDTLGGSALVPVGTPTPGTLTAAGYQMGNYPADNQGLTLANWVGAAPSSDANYTIQINFDFTQIPPPNPTTYDQIINFNPDAADPNSDNGILLQGTTVANTSLDAYNGGPNNGPPGLFQPGVPFDLIIERDGATGQVTGYVNGVQALTFNDNASQQMIFTSPVPDPPDPSNLITFFEDIDAVPDETSGGTVTSIKIYNRPLTNSEIGVVWNGGTLGGTTSIPADLDVSGGGELVLSGANTYTGTTYVNQGTLTVANNNALGGTAIAGEQSISLTNPVAGTTAFNLSYDGVATGPITYTGTAADAANIQNALNGLSSINSTTLTGTTNGTITVSGLSNTGLLGVGNTVSGVGILPGTTIASIVNGTTITLSQAAGNSTTEALTFGTSILDGATNGTATVTGLSSTANLEVGMPVSGVGIPAGTTIAAINSGTSITLSAAATNSATEPLTFGNVSVIQENSGVFLVNFYGVLSNTQTLISPSIVSGGVSGTAIAAGYEGGTEVASGAQIQLQGGITVAGEPLTVEGSGSNLVPTEQIFTVGTTTTGGFSGTYELSFGGQTTQPLPYNATAAQVQSALDNLSSVNGVGGQVEVNLISTNAGADDTQTLFVPGTATNATNFGLTFGPTTYDASVDSTGNIFTVANSYSATDPFSNATDIANALNKLTNVTEEGGLVDVSGELATEDGVDGMLYTITFAGGLADQSGLPELAVQAPSGPGAAGIAMESHTAGSAPSNTFQVTFQGSFSSANQPLLTVPAQTLTTSVSTPAVVLAGGSTNNTPDQWFSLSQGTGTVSTAVTAVDSYTGVSNLENAAGPVVSVAVDPTDASVIYIATAGGGAWKTVNDGQSWQPLFDSAFAGANPAVMFGGSIAIDPEHVNVIYYATGNGDGSGQGGANLAEDSYYGTGVYMSTDSGATWTLLTDPGNAAYTVNVASPGNPLYGTAISSIVVLDANGNTPYEIAVSASDADPGTGVDVNGDVGNAGVWFYNQGTWTNTTAGVEPTNVDAVYPGLALPSTDAVYSDLYYDGNTMYMALSDNTKLEGVYSVANFLATPSGPWAWNPVAFTPNNIDTGSGDTVWTVTNDPATPYFVGMPVTGANVPLGTTVVAVTATTFTLSVPESNTWGALTFYQFGGQQDDMIKLSGDAGAGAVYASTSDSNGLFDISMFDPAINNPATGVNDVWARVADDTPDINNIVNYMASSGDYANAIGVNPNNGTVYVGGTGTGSGDNIVLDSGNNGAAWNDLSNASATGPQDGVHAITTTANGDVYVASDGGLWEYSGGTWIDLTGNLADTEVNSVSTDPNNPNIVLAGTHATGVDLYYDGAIADATEAGGVVTAVNLLDGDSGYNPGSPPTVTFVGGGGSGATATAQVSAAGVVTGFTNLVGGSGYTSTPEVVIAPSGVQTWVQVAAGGDNVLAGDGAQSDGGEVEFDPSDPGFVYYQAAGQLKYSTDNGATWTNSFNPYGNPPPEYAPFEAAPSEPTDVVGGDLNVGDIGVFSQIENGNAAVSLDLAGFKVTALAVADFQGPYQADPAFSSILALPSNQPDPSTIYVTNGTSVEVTKNDGITWAANRGPTLDAGTTISDIIVNPADRDTAWVVTSGYSGTAGVGHVFETTNAGQTWTDISAGLPDQSVWTIADDPFTNTLYVGTDSGVYELADGVGTWQKFSVGLPNVMVTDININTNANVLTISTYGRGVWQYNLDDTDASAGALRSVAGANVWDGPVTFAGATTVGVNGSQNLQDGFSGSQLTILGTISDSTSNAVGNTLTKVGGGNLVLAGANTYAGVTLDTQGNIVVDNPDALGSPGAISLTGVTSATSPVVTGLSSTADLAVGMPVVGTGIPGGTTILQIDSATSVTLSNTPTSPAPSGETLTFNAGTQLLYFNDMVAGVSQFNLSFGSGAGSTTSIPLVYEGVAATDATDIQAALQGLTTIGSGNVTVTPEGSGVFLLTFSGPLADTQELATATIANSVDGPLGAAFSEVAGGTVVESGAALELESSLALEPITVNGNGILPPFNGHYTGAIENISNSNTYTGTITLGSNSTVGVTAGELTIDSANGDGVVDGGTPSTAYSLDKEGDGTLVLAGPDSYQGGTTITAGAIEIENSDALGAATVSGLAISAGSDVVSGFSSTADLSAGMPVSGAGIPSGTTVLSVTSATSITLSDEATATSASATLTFAFTSSTLVSDGAQLQMSASTGPTLAAAASVAGGGLSLNTTYYYVVTAVSANGDESAVSNEISFTPTTAGIQAASLAWSPVAGASTYNVYRSTTPGNFTGGLVASGLALTSFTDTDSAAQPGTPGGLDVLGQQLYLTGSGLTNNGALSNVAGNNIWAGLITLAAVPNYSVTSSPEGVVAVYVDPTNTLTLSGDINEGPPAMAPVQNSASPASGPGLTPGTTYYYVVTAVTPYGETAVSNQQSYTASGSNDQATISWSEVPGATGYNIYRSTISGNFTDALVGSVSGGTTTTFLDLGAAASAVTPNTAASAGLAEIGAGTLVLAGDNSYSGGTYVGYVFGNVNDSGATQPSLIGSGGVNGGVIDIESSTALGDDQGNEVQRVVTYEPPNTNPAQTFTLSFDGASTANLPFGDSASNVQTALDGLSTISGDGGSVSVAASSVQTGLDEVQTVTLTNPTSPLNVPTGFSVLVAAGGNLAPTSTYYYEVTAVIPGLGETMPTSEQSVITSNAITDNLSATLSWTAVPGATSYDIYRSTVSGDFAQSYLTTVTGTSYTDAGASAALSSPTLSPVVNTTIGIGGSLPVGVTYEYVVTALGPSGESAFSAPLAVTISSSGSQEVNLSWSVVPGATGYRIYRSTTVGDYSNTLIAVIDSGATTSYTDTGVISASLSPPVQTKFSLQFSIVLTGTNNLNVIQSLPSTSQLAVGMAVGGAGIPAGTVITKILNGTSVQISNNATNLATESLTFTATTSELNYLGVGGRGSGGDAFNMQNALEALAPIGANNVIVTPDATDTVFTITFVGALADTPQNAIAPTAGAQMTGTTTGISSSVTGLLSTSQLVPGMLVFGTGIPSGTSIVAINSGTAITLSNDATASGTPTLTFVEPTTSAAGVETTSGDGGVSIIYTVQFNGAPLSAAAQPLLVATSNSNQLIVSTSEAATGGIGALVYNGSALEVDGDPTESNPNTSTPDITVAAGETLALNGNGMETLTLAGATVGTTKFTLQVGTGPYTVGVNKTSAISYTGADAAAVQSALDALTAISGSVGSVQVSQANAAGRETFIITGLNGATTVSGTVTSADAAFFNAPSSVAGALVNASGDNLWQGNVVLQSSSTVAANPTTDLTVTGLVQNAAPNNGNPVPTTAPASLTKVGSGTISLAPATQVINLTNAVSALDVPTLNVPTVSGSIGSGAVSTAYYYEVTAIGPGGETLPSTPEKPATTPNDQLVGLTWTVPAGFTASGFRVYRSATGTPGSFTLLANIDSGTTLSLTDNGILPPPPITLRPPTQTQFTITVGGFATSAITYTGAASLEATIQTQLQAVLTAHFAGVTANVAALSANSFTVTLSGAGTANVPPITAAIAGGTPGQIAVNTNTFTGDVYDNAGVLNIQSAQALGVSTSAVEEVSVSGTSGSFSLIFDSPATSGTTSAGSPTVTGISPSAIGLVAVGMEVFGAGIPTGTTITAVNSITDTITLSASASAGATVPLTFGTGALQYGLPASGGASPTASVENALDALPVVSSVDPNGVTVSQVGNNYFVYFNGAGFAYHYQNPITYQIITPGISSIVITHPLAGGAANVDVANGATLQMQSGTAAQAFSEDSGKYLTIAGLGYNGAGALDNAAGSNAWSATPITLGTPAAAIGASAGSTLAMNEPITDSSQAPTLEFNNFSAGDTYSLSYGGAVTGPLQYSASAATNQSRIQAALAALSSVISLDGTVQVTIVSAAKQQFDVTFSNTHYGTITPGLGALPVTSASGSFGTPPASQTTLSRDYGVDKVGAGTLIYDVGNMYTGLTDVVAGTLELDNTTSAGSGFAVPASLQIGDATLVPQVQTLTLTGFQQLDQFTLSYGAITTLPITYYQNPAYEAAQIQAALNAALGVNYASVSANSSTSFAVSLPGLGNPTPAATTLIGGSDTTTNTAVVGSTITTQSSAFLSPGSTGAPTVQLEKSTTATAGQINPASTVSVLNDGLFDVNDFSQAISGLTITGGVVSTGVAAAGAGALTVNGPVSISENGALDLPGPLDNVTITGLLTMIGGSVNITGAGSLVDLQGNLTAQSDPTTLAAAEITGQGTLELDSLTPLFTINQGGGVSDLVVSAPISASAADTSGALTKTGPGRLELAAVNTYSGPTNIDQGDVQVDSIFQVQFSASPVWTSGDTFELTYNNGLDSASTTNIVYTGTTGAGGTGQNILTALVDLLMAAPFNLTVALAQADVAVNPISNNIFNVALLGIAGSELGLLSATVVSSLHSGTMTVTAADAIGNVVLNGSAPDSATLSGTGTVDNVTIQGGAYGTVNPGVNGTSPATPGILNTSGNVAFNTSPSNGTFFVDLNDLSGDHPNPNPGTDYDQLNVNGNVTLNNALLAGSPTGANIDVNDTFVIMQATGQITGQLDADIYGQIVPIGQGGSVFLNGEKFTVQYNTVTFNPAETTDNSIVLTRQQADLTSFNLVSSANPSVYGQNVSFYALATPELGASFATANPVVTFTLDGGGPYPYTQNVTLNPGVQEVSLTAFNPGDLFALTYFNGLQAGQTGNITYAGASPADAANDALAIQSALNLLLSSAPFNFSASSASVSALDSNDFLITFSGSAAANVYPLLGNVVSSLSGSIAVATVATYTPETSIPTVWSPTFGSPHVITATFGDTTGVFASPAVASGSPLYQNVNQNTVNIGLTSTLTGNQATYGQSFNLTATLSPATPLNLAGALNPTSGTLTFYVDGLTGPASYTTGFTYVAPPGSSTFTQPIPGSLLLAPGPHTIDVTYSGDANYAGTATITTFHYSFTVVADSSTLSFTPTPVNSDLGQEATFNVLVGPALAGSTGQPQGAVNFYNGNPTAGGVLLNASTATNAGFNIPAVGHTTTISVASTAGIAVGQYLYISGGGNIILASVVAPGVSGSNVTIQTDTIVAGNVGALVASGAAVVLSSGVNPVTGAASFSTPTLTLGSHNIYAVFTSANDDYTGVTNNYPTFVVEKASTSAVIQTPLPSASYGSATTFQVQVAEAPSIASVFPALNPTGSVTMYAQVGAATTTGGFLIPAVGTPEAINVASTTGFSPGQLVYVTDGTNVLIATVNSVQAGPPQLTIQPTVLIAGVAGAAMGAGATVSAVINLGTGSMNAGGLATIITQASGANALPVGVIPLIAVYSGDANFAVSEDASQTITVTGAPDGVTVTSASPNPGNYNNPITLTATVSSSVPGLPTGVAGSYVTFWDGPVGVTTETTAGFTIVAVNNTTSIQVASTPGLATNQPLYITDGTNIITATITAIGPGNSVTIQTTAILAGSVGNTMAAGASVADTTLGTVELTAADNASLTVPAGAVPAGLNTIYASYADTVDSHFVNGTDTPLSNYAVDGAPTSITSVTASWSTSPTDAVYDQPVTFTATVTSPSLPITVTGTAASSVTFVDTTTHTTLGVGFLTFSGGAYTATITTTTAVPLTAATHTITATYNDTADAYFKPSSGTLSNFMVTPAPTAVTSLTSSSVGGTSALGQAVTYTATVDTQAPSTVAPVTAGTVTFYDIAPTALTTTKATFGITNVGVSTGPISVNSTTGMADGSLLEISDGTNVIVGSITSFVTNSSVTLTTVAVLQGSGTMGSGASVSSAVKLNATPISVNASGQASVNVTYSTTAQIGTHTIWAAYSPPTSGTINYLAGTPMEITQSVLKDSKVTVAALAGKSYGQQLMYTVTVTSPIGTGAPAGHVVLTFGANTYTSTPLAPGGGGSTATITVPGGVMNVGSTSLLFTYNNDLAPLNTWESSTATISQSISAVTPTMLLGALPSTTSEFGENVTFTATLTTVSSSPGFLPQNGTITLKDGTSTLQSFTLTGSSSGAVTYNYGSSTITVTYQTSTLAIGSQAITASFGGNSSPADFAASNVASLTQKVVADSALGTLGTTAWTVGQSYSSTITLTKSAAATGTVTLAGLSASGLPPGLNITGVTNTAAAAVITISGTPTTSGPYMPTIYATDSADVTVSRTYTIVINAAPSLSPVDGSVLPTGTYKSAYSTTINIVGGTPAFKSLSVTGLPTGLTYSLSGSTIRIYGTPTAPNVYSNVHVSVLDAAGVAATGTYSITINPAATTVTALSVSSLTPLEGAPVVFTAVVSSSAGTPYAATGKLAFYDSSLGFLGYGTVVSDTATTATYQLHYTYATSGFSGAGSRSITAQYLGSNPTSSATELFGQSPVSNALAVNVVNTQMTLTASTTTPNPNQLVTFTATLTVVGATPAVGDVIDFYENGVMIGSATITGSGPTYKVTFTRAFPAGQLDTITASFAGDAGSLDAASNSIEINTKSTLR